MIWLVTLVAGAAAAALMFWRRKPPDPPPTGIVLLLRAPVELTAARLAELFTEAAGAPVKTLDIDALDASGGRRPAGNVVMGRPPHFVAIVDGATFVAHSMPGKYSDSRQPHPDLRLRRAIELHQAWLSVDILQPRDAAVKNYAIAASVLAHFAGPECVALYSPARDKLVARTEESADQLRSGDPLAAVFQNAAS